MPAGIGASARPVFRGLAWAQANPASKARSLRATISSPFFANRFRRPARTVSGARPNHPAISPSTTVFLALSVPAVSFAIASIPTATTSAGFTPATGIASGATFVFES